MLCIQPTQMVRSVQELRYLSNRKTVCCTIQLVYTSHMLFLSNVGPAELLPLAHRGFLSQLAPQPRHEACGRIAPEKQHHTSRGDDTNQNSYSCGRIHLIIALPLPSAGNHTANVFSAGLDRQIFGELFCSPGVVACTVLRF